MTLHNISHSTATTVFALHEMTRSVDEQRNPGSLDMLRMFAPSPLMTTRRTNNRCVSICTTGKANTTGASQHQADVRLSSPIALHFSTSATHLSAFRPLHKYRQRQLCESALSDVSKDSHKQPSPVHLVFLSVSSLPPVPFLLLHPRNHLPRLVSPT